MRATLHYITAFVLLIIYGGQVCPLIDTLTIPHWGSLLSAAFLAIILTRYLVLPHAMKNATIYDQPTKQFALEFGLFIFYGFMLALYNTFALGFPVWESGPKVILGFVIFGFFIGLDLSLKRERDIGKGIAREIVPENKTNKYTSLTRKFSVFALATVALIGSVIILAVAKDIFWMLHHPEAAKQSSTHIAILAEVAFILFTLCAYTLLIIRSYTRNITLFFGNETHVLRKVRSGDLSERVLPLTRDEFGEIADHTNAMIEGLRERDRIKNVFGKAVSPTIATRLMHREAEGMSLGGAMEPLVILMADIRDFTARTESSPPEAVISELNLWLAEAVESICDHDGIVDKFIGDGILAVFGLDGETNACEKAIACAQDMLRRLNQLAPGLSAPMEIGIGIHKGEVLAGIIGSPERLEFTVIGDVTNTTARIEAMTREINTTILISEAVFTDLPPTSDKENWTDHGEWSLKGKARPVRLYGLT